MTKALREMQERISSIDIVFYVLDSRAVRSCINSEFNRIIAGKKIIYILNKADLVEPVPLKKWQKELSSEGSEAVIINSVQSGASGKILPLVQKLCREKIEKYRQKGIRITLRAMVLGVPNSGKSTLINNFCAKAKTKTGNKPGVTRGQQWLKANEWLELLDTPGTLYPKLDDQTAAKRLAFIGSIKDEVVDKTALAKELLGEIKLETSLEKIAQSRGFILKGAELDIERAAISVLDDFRKGRFGKIMLDLLAG